MYPTASTAAVTTVVQTNLCSCKKKKGKISDTEILIVFCAGGKSDSRSDEKIFNASKAS